MAKRILIIDDDPDFAEAVSSLLESNGYAVASALCTEDGLAQACKKPCPDCILLDVMMAGKVEGFEFSRTLRDNPDTSNIPVILVTGIRRDLSIPYALEPDREWLPVKAILEKPIRPDTLLKTIAENL
ncbi:MAG: response regulator [Spirochaetaceae bacterium]|nr:MAG: response regulator [Spirochaetaceae bacterium]